MLIAPLALPASAEALTYANTTPIVVPDIMSGNQTTPFPSTISVPATGVIADVNVTLTGITHSAPFALVIRMIGPTGQSVILMTGSGSYTVPVSNVNLTLDDEASAFMPYQTPLMSGTFKPTDGYPTFFQANGGPHAKTLSALDGTSPTGTWSLEVGNYAPGFGTIAGGWGLEITLASVTAGPNAGKVGDAVILAGAGFTGATSVRFGSTPAAAFTVDSATQITATVPAGAGTGPIQVIVPGGTITSAESFVLRHGRRIALSVNGERATGTMNAVDAFSACASRVPVAVQHLEGRRWRTVAGVLTRKNGSFKAVGLDEPGKYRAVAKKTKLSSGDVCLRRLSGIVTV